MNSQEIWFKENVSPEEWEAFAQKADKDAQEREQQKINNYAEDVWDFYANAMISMYSKRAEIARNQGIYWVIGLVDADSNEVVDAKIVDGKFGKVWCIKHEDGSVEWVNISQASSIKKQQAFYRSKGYQKAYIYYHFAEGRHGFYPIKERGVVDVEVWADDLEVSDIKS